ncbi:sensor histidine kinase [Spirosoma pulveris]
MNNQYTFLTGGGEMGARTRQYDWSKTVLGLPSQWSSNLCTTVSLLLKSRVPMFLLWGNDLICFYNDAYRPILGAEGKYPDPLGKPGAAVWPTIGPITKVLVDSVLKSGEAIWGEAQLVSNCRSGKDEAQYWTFDYSPVPDESGMPTGVLVTGMEETGKAMEEAEITLRGAIELAELGTWQIDLSTSTLYYSERLREWFGIGSDEIITPERAYRPVREVDRPRVRAAIAEALTPGTSGIYDIEYTLDANEAGQERILHILGRTFYNEKGEPFKISGTAQDVTKQRRVQQELERQVQERTRQLEMLIVDLERSNANLQQFAYVASHDLQEPLRKVQAFGDILKEQYGSELNDGVNYLERMQSAASRMSVLIKDLLTFSRIATRQDTTTAVSLNDVLTTALTDLELVVQETNAVVEVADLPTITGDKVQLTQLFQNLLSNSLKFGQSTVQARIRISCQRIDARDLPELSDTTYQAMAYYRIDVNDNGIGFDPKYVDRIFEVFQRLHGKNEYAGTGIGLAICEKVVANHGGFITATSQPGQGATFSVYLPA